MPRVIGLVSRARTLESSPAVQDARSSPPAQRRTHFPAATRAAKRSQTPLRARDRFLSVYAKLGNVTYAAKAAGVGRATVYLWAEHDADFALRMRQAEIEATEVLEREAWRRARDGVAEPVFQHGRQVGTIQRYSDNLLMFLLKARAPDRYGSKVDLTLTPTIKAVAGFEPESVL